MNAMRMPGFTADASLYGRGGHYNGGPLAETNAGAVVPAIPNCANCDWILDNCERNGWRPRAVCSACATGHCYEDPPLPNPYPDPFPPFPRW